MRVLVERGSVSEDVLERIASAFPAAEVLVLERGELEALLRDDDHVVARG
jgi:hypothetical protein